MQEIQNMQIGSTASTRYYPSEPGPSRPTRVAVISDAEPARNGVGAYYHDLAEHLCRRGFEVRTFCPIAENGNSSAALAFPLPGDTSQRLCLPNPFGLNARLAAFNADIAIIPTPGVYGLTGAFLCERLGLPVLVGFHTAFEQLAKLYWQKTVMAKMVRQYFRNSHNYLFGRCTGVVANTEEMCRLARRLGAGSVTRVGTLLPGDFIDTPVRPHSGRISRILFAGRLAAEKNIDALLQAARNLPEMKFSIAGDGPLKPQVQAANNTLPNLNYMGWLSRPELKAAIDSHDMLVLPSHFESFGNIALEAMARQRPAIVTSRCGIAKWSELQRGLHVIDEGSALTEALEYFSRMPTGQVCEMAAAALEAAIRLNDSSLDQWCDMLAPTNNLNRVSAQ